MDCFNILQHHYFHRLPWAGVFSAAASKCGLWSCRHRCRRSRRRGREWSKCAPSAGLRLRWPVDLRGVRRRQLRQALRHPRLQRLQRILQEERQKEVSQSGDDVDESCNVNEYFTRQVNKRRSMRKYAVQKTGDIFVELPPWDRQINKLNLLCIFSIEWLRMDDVMWPGPLNVSALS